MQKLSQSSRNRALGVLAVGVVVVGFLLWKRQSLELAYSDATQPAPPAVTDVLPEPTPPGTKPSEPPPKEPAPKPADLPAEFNLSVPFVKQAPTGNWDAVHEETCEEAAVLTVHAYYAKQKPTDAWMESELMKLVDLEKKLFGYFEDTTVAETVKFAKEAYGFRTGRIMENPSIEDFKREIRAGHPVIVPTNGKQLHNPNFTNGGPLYHNLVLRGWNAKGFFTNDPGTRKGENYFYDYATIMNAMHDWTPADHMANGPKRAILLIP